MHQDCSKLNIVPIDFNEACEFIRKYHRHHKPPIGHKFSLAVANDSGVIVGVATVGGPVARYLDNGFTLEVNRTCTDGTKNANSALYGACWRAARALGYRKLITYTLKEESGISLDASGWKCIGEAGGGTWDRKKSGRPRIDTHPTQAKLKWEKL